MPSSHAKIYSQWALLMAKIFMSLKKIKFTSILQIDVYIYSLYIIHNILQIT